MTRRIDLTRRGFLGGAAVGLAAGVWAVRGARSGRETAAGSSRTRGGLAREARLRHRWREVVVPAREVGPSGPTLAG